MKESKETEVQGNGTSEDEKGNENEIPTLLESSKYYPRWLQEIRGVIYLTFEIPESSAFAKFTSIFILVVILLSICCFIFETVQKWKDMQFWNNMEIFSTVVFTIEYVLRFWTCPVYGKYTYFKFFISPMNLLDIAAIIPFYIEVVLSGLVSVKGLRVLRTVRLIRLFRVFKLGRYNSGMMLMIGAVSNSMPALSILCFFLIVGVVLFSSLLFYAERLSCPNTSEWTSDRMETYRMACDASSTGWSSSFRGELCCDDYGSQRDFPSIAHTGWWSMVTMTTVGFGGQVPRTIQGKLIGVMSMLVGILLISLPVAIVGNKFQEVFDQQLKDKGLKQQQEKESNPGTKEPQQKQLRYSQVIALRRKQRTKKLSSLVSKYQSLVTDPKSPAHEHAAEISRLLEESTRLERRLCNLTAEDERLQRLIVRGFQAVIASVVPMPEKVFIDESVNGQTIQSSIENSVNCDISSSNNVKGKKLNVMTQKKVSLNDKTISIDPRATVAITLPLDDETISQDPQASVDTYQINVDNQKNDNVQSEGIKDNKISNNDTNNDNNETKNGEIIIPLPGQID